MGKPDKPILPANDLQYCVVREIALDDTKLGLIIGKIIDHGRETGRVDMQ